MTSTNSSNFDIAIVGGGIGGITLLIGLLNQGVNVHLYESAAAFGEIGAGVAFGPNAARAMSLIDKGIKDGFDECGTFNGWQSKRDVWFDYRWGMDQKNSAVDGVKRKSGQHICSVICGHEGQACVHRANFLDEMVKLVPPGAASFGKRLNNIEETDDGVKLLFDDGTISTASAVVGCDGIKSKTRQILLGEDNPASHAVFSGKYVYRGLIPMDEAVGLLGDELARNCQMYCGYHGHVLTFPIQKGRTMNVVAFASKDSWTDPQWVIPGDREQMMKDFQGWGENVLDILKLMQKTDIWALFNHLPADTYYKAGKICLLGDAAHATTPHQGSGAGMAIEDAYILSNLLGTANSKQQLEAAFHAYDSVRRERTQRVVTTSREAGRLYDLELEGYEDSHEKVGDNLLERCKWIWEEDLEGELRIAKELMCNFV